MTSGSETPTAMRGDADLVRAADAIAARLPEPLKPLGALAYNYSWSWLGGDEVFRSVSPHRWEMTESNPVRLLTEAPIPVIEAAAARAGLVERVVELDARVRSAVEAPMGPGVDGSGRPVAFLCAEFGVHQSLPVYSGGLGILAGDILKESSDRGLPMVGVGLFYRQGYFRQRLDRTGWQHEFWTPVEPERVPAVLVTNDDGRPLLVRVPVAGDEVVVQVWRVQVGRVPLFLLDASRPENSAVDMWITSRLYVSDREVRLMQYALLGVGAVRVLEALGIEPALVHLNEGHAAFATVEMLRRERAAGRSFDEARAAVRARTVFTTHTPVPAGNESFPAQQVLRMLPDLGADAEQIVELARNDGSDEIGLTPLAMRMSRSTNAVSRRHGEVSREMWAPLFPEVAVQDVPVTHVTNGVHVPTWTTSPMRQLLDRHLGDGWWHRASDPATWEGVAYIPDEELWAARNAQRAALVEYVRRRSTRDRLNRGDPLPYVTAAEQTFSTDYLIVGSARRVAMYKRLYLLVFDPVRAIGLVSGTRPAQTVLAGKAHPLDDEAKQLIKNLFGLRAATEVAQRVAFLEDYDMAMASRLVAGADVWLNTPLPPLEASGTSGMKAAFNGGLHLSILDGWWEEGFNGDNGWGVRSSDAVDPEARDAADATEFYRLIESEVVPLFYHRGEDGIPHGWIAKIKSSLRTLGPQFCASRMLDDYCSAVYPARV